MFEEKEERKKKKKTNKLSLCQEPSIPYLCLCCVVFPSSFPQTTIPNRLQINPHHPPTQKAACNFSLRILAITAGSGGPPEALTSSLVMVMALTSGATAAMASWTCLIWSGGRLPAKTTALGTWRAPASTLALEPMPEACGAEVSPEQRAGSSARASSWLRETWTTEIGCVNVSE